MYQTLLKGLYLGSNLFSDKASYENAKFHCQMTFDFWVMSNWSFNGASKPLVVDEPLYEWAFFYNFFRCSNSQQYVTIIFSLLTTDNLVHFKDLEKIYLIDTMTHDCTDVIKI